MGSEMCIRDSIYPSTFLTLNDPDWVEEMPAGTAVFAAVVDLDPGESFTTQITFDISMFTPGMSLVNVVEITEIFDEDDDPLTDGNTDNDTDDEQIVVSNLLVFDMSLNKSVSPLTPSPNFFNDEIEFLSLIHI